MSKSLKETIQERIDRVQKQSNTERDLEKVHRWNGVYYDKLNKVYVLKVGQRILGEYPKAEEAADAFNEFAKVSMGFPKFNHTKKFKATQEVTEDLSPVAETPRKVSENPTKKEEPVKEVPNEPSEKDTITKLLEELNYLMPQKSEQDGPSE